MLEVEMKFRLPDAAALEQRLAALNVEESTVLNEEDYYFNAPDRDFASTDEALRLRRIGQANFVTYKGPKQDLQTKTRPEIEVPLANGDEVAARFRQLLVRLGYRPVAVVRKRRRVYRSQVEGFPLEICLDDVDEVGQFAELEILATEAQFAPARDVLLRMAGQLGLGESERRSYLQMLLESRARA